jgi:fructosamine-3-kinase
MAPDYSSWPVAVDWSARWPHWLTGSASCCPTGPHRRWLIDPSTHGGHPEEDLAMLGLFGPVPDRTLGAYREVRSLPDGWRGRVGLFQLYPLLVHTVLFDGGYRAQAEAVLAGLA